MPAPQQGSQSDNSASLLWGVAGVFVALGMIWFAFKKYIVMAYLTVKLYEAYFLGLFSPSRFEPLQNGIINALTHPNNIKFPDLMLVGTIVGDWLRYPFVVILFVLAVVVYFGNSTRIFRRLYNMNDLVTLEQVNWPQITPVAGLDLVKTDLDKGPWAMGMTPMQFCKRFKLLEEYRPARVEGMNRRDWDRIEVTLKKGEANTLFSLQLGALWQGADKLPPYVRALFAVFAARINADTDAAAKLIRQLNITCATKLDTTGTDELLKKHENTKIVQEILETHAYVLTVMASMLERARDDGVQASADFLWLKPLDRRLWYTLNTVGRQTPFVEVGGIFAHWIAEKEAGRKLLVPMVDEATKALELALKDVVYRPDVE